MTKVGMATRKSDAINIAHKAVRDAGGSRRFDYEIMKKRVPLIVSKNPKAKPVNYDIYIFQKPVSEQLAPRKSPVKKPKKQKSLLSKLFRF